jgi:hypothetical protein
MLQPGAEPDLPEEARRAERGGELGTHDLERDGPVVLQVMSQPDGGHTAVSELALEGVAVGEGGLEAFEDFGQSGLTGMGRLKAIAEEASEPGSPGTGDSSHRHSRCMGSM